MIGYLRTMTARALRSIVGAAGGVILSRQDHKMLIEQVNRAAMELATFESEGLMPGLSGVVFSKDRPLQLYSLLYSYAAHVVNPVPLNVIYTASSDEYARAYVDIEQELKCSALQVRFVKETSGFRQTLLNVLNGIQTKNLFFLVDDIVFIRPLDLTLAAAIDPTQCILSFRHSPRLRRSYTASADQQPPEFSPAKEGGDVVRFRWFEQGNEWSNPWSVDGQVLSTAEVRVLSRLSDYKAPNSYEGALTTFCEMVRGRDGMCYMESKTLNLAINRVQTEVPNVSGNISADFLLEQWNNGLMLDLTDFDGYVPRAPHEEWPVRFVSRGTFVGTN